MKNALLRLLYNLLRITRPRARGEINTVLVLQYQMPLGCCVHGTPIYAAIKAAHPDVTIVVATRGLGAAVLQHDPHVDRLLLTADPTPSFAARRAVAAEIRSQLSAVGIRPDLILQDASNRAGSYALLAALLRIAPTAGFANAAALYDTHLEYDGNLSLIDNNLRLAELTGARGQHLEPGVYCSASELANAKTLLLEANPTGKPVTAFVLQGSGGQRTGWHDDRFAAVLRHVEASGHQAIFLGTAGDATNIERIRALAGSSGTSLAGRTTVPELAALLCLCDLLVTLDTGTMHVGRAADVPMVVLGPSWQKPLEWLPLGKPNVRILRGSDREGVPAEYRLDEIATADVIVAIDDLQVAYPPSKEQQNVRIARLLSSTRL